MFPKNTPPWPEYDVAVIFGNVFLVFSLNPISEYDVAVIFGNVFLAFLLNPIFMSRSFNPR